MKLRNSETQNLKNCVASVLCQFSLFAFLCFDVFAFLPGCIGGTPDAHIKQIQELQDKVADQGRQLAAKDGQIKSQSDTIQQLRGGGGKLDTDSLVHVGKIELEGLSGGYDDNSDGVDDGIVLYLRVLDTEGEVIKSAGSASIRLLDLSKPEGQQSLLAASFTPEQLKTLWFGRFMTAHYTIKFPFDEKFKRLTGDTLTAVVTFSELLTGRSFDTQQVLNLKKSPR
jgi:hypothetical protein